MSGFLEQTARAAHDRESLVLVLPTPRAVLFFDQCHLKLFDRRPECDVKDWTSFLASLSPLRTTDKLTLIFELFKQYPRDDKPDLDLFYTWAEVIIRDFSEIDAHLIPPETIFANIEDWQTHADPPSSYLDQADDYRRFWEVLGKEEKEFKRKFVENWGTLAELYRKYTENLRRRGWAYYGMKVRDACMRLDNGEIRPGAEREYWFAGFNRLSKGEAHIVRGYIGTKGKFIYDGDDYFMRHGYHDAGMGYRALKKHGIAPTVFRPAPVADKRITFVGAALKVGQAGALGQYLHELGEGHDWERTAVVLPDDSSLAPILDALPANVPVVNVTAGYSIARHPLFTLTQKLFDLQTSARLSDTGAFQFFFPDVQYLLSHPYLNAPNPKAAAELLRYLQKNRIVYPDALYLSDPARNLPDLYRTIFQRVGDVAEWNAYLLDVYAQVLTRIAEQHSLKADESPHVVENEIVYFYYGAVKHLESLRQKYPDLLSFSLWRKLFRRFVRTTQLPFEGEPLVGMQIIGIEETPALDFDTVVFFHANEEIWPPNGFPATFVPPQIRSAFGLPYTRELQADASYATYRLFSRARDVVFVYNNVPDGGGEHGKEPSRFLLQIEHDWMPMYSQPPIRRLNAEAHAHRPKIEPVVGLKNETVAARLEAYCDHSSRAPYFSPSSLTTLMACELRFYFQYLLKIDERDEFSKTIEHDEIGRLLHKTLELFYMADVEKKKFANIDGYVKRYGPRLDKTLLEKHLGELDEFIAAAMRAERIDPDELKSGENFLRFRVVHEMARKIVFADIQAADEQEIQILDAEKEVFTRISINNGQRIVKIGGTLDRIDRRDGKYYILDYKTGRGGLGVRYDSQNDTLSYDPYAFQGLMYAWVFAEKMKSAGQSRVPPSVGFYMPALGGETLRLLPDTLWTADDKKSSAYDEIPALIDTLLTDIYSPEHAFLQTDQRKECTYCPYNGICFRN